jgi:UDP-2-acetamido-2,6-beta-L-arabino-hexul-4-ose reductase
MKNKNILITGSNGFIGFNLKTVLIENGFKVLEFKKQNSLSFLKKQIQNSSFIFHLAGTNRSKKKKNLKITMLI